jgi:hypothetical protein
MKNNKPLPCPFCDNKDLTIYVMSSNGDYITDWFEERLHTEGENYAVICESGCGFGSDTYLTIETLMEKWNRRPVNKFKDFVYDLEANIHHTVHEDGDYEYIIPPHMYRILEKLINE